MKKNLFMAITVVAVSLLLSLLLVAPVSAETIDNEAVDDDFQVGEVLPDHHLYGLERVGEISDKFAADGPEEALIGLEIAEKRLGEINAMIEDMNPDPDRADIVQTLAQDYQDELDELNDIKAELADEEREDVEDKVSNAMNKHYTGLEKANLTITGLMDQVPEEAIPGLENATQSIQDAHEKSDETREEALSHLEEVNPLKAAENRLAFAETRIDNTNELQEQGHDRHVQDRANAYSDEMDKVMDLIDKSADQEFDTEELEEKVAYATLKHMDVLENISEKVPAEAQEAIERAMNASITGHETALDNLPEQKQQEIRNYIEENHPGIKDNIRDIVNENAQQNPSTQNIDEKPTVGGVL
ncbi:DUF5667 domain-containing protein [Methanonatronarchaeum sp. AMET-Sl]|uniref:DUF5667 domain-containing protein n=1 Tax=Methanonatronarchaeum sp. AMET-Sl TaxID=3037654 RepID=UPI00244E09E6|nr:DUF5667 domain-containing protein [Methanonatronarchaeum sp. AMET-Sl]WGI16855.1 DUF5667 domain-containing protein [Methanonatronarchaeum sp. AMET-Sl]